VVAAMSDPFPPVSGNGLAILQAAGLQIDCGICELDSHLLNAAYLKRLREKKCYIHAKWAMTLDGKIATATGHSQWISNSASRARVHQLRGVMDGILIGRGTLISDDPLLTARPPGPRVPIRMVLTRGSEELPHDFQLLRTLDQGPVFLITSKEGKQKLDRFQKLGCEIVTIQAAENGSISIPAMLEEFSHRGLTNVLVEGGTGVLGSFRDADAIDEVHCFIAPKLAGGIKAFTPMAGKGVEKMSDSTQLWRYESERIEDDIYLHGWTRNPMLHNTFPTK
jgi:diaminohydroxyphosphoribosylaminopyrimidine deaminase/5-amino-6-(5-phosphoribosylamino)uracil reductase